MKSTPIEIRKGSTYISVVHWEEDVLMYKQITAIVSLAPIRLTVANHGLTDGWRFAVESVQSMIELNTLKPLVPATWYKAKIVDPNTIEINDVNGSEFTAYNNGGGVIKFYAPVNMANFTARMSIKNKFGGTVLANLTTENGYLNLDNVNKKINIKIPDSVTSPITEKKGVYDLELIANSGEVYPVAGGPVVFKEEVTT